MDGVNNNVIGFCLLLLVSIYIIEYKNDSFENLHFYHLFLLSLVIFYLFMGIILELNNYFFIGILFVAINLFVFQIFNFDKTNKLKCLNIFKSNSLLGLIILVNIFIGKM